jgi:hypothetical protein
LEEIKYITRKGAPEQLSSFTDFSIEDRSLVQALDVDRTFNQSSNRLEVHFYTLDGRHLKSIVDSTNYTVLAGGSKDEGSIEDIVLKPDQDIINAGYSNGDVNVLYNFVNNLYTRTKTRPTFFIESISPDRREIRALTNELNDNKVLEFTEELKTKFDTQEFFEDFRLNFGSNILPIAINIDSISYRDSRAVIIRLYEPLLLSIGVKDTFLIEELVGDSVLYQVETEISRTEEDTRFALRGPNYDIPLVEENNNPTGYLNYNELFSYPVSNSYYEVYSLFNEKSAQISIDHRDFNEFIHFSSAEERVRNFYYKVGLIQSYSQSLAEGSGNAGKLRGLISGAASNFDHYERYLYYETGSFAWPKTTSTRPYELYSTGSVQAQDWYSRTLISASNFDTQNLNRLTDTIPSFIRDDSNNAPYLLFVDMVGQHFDNLWIYMKAVTEKYNADNRLDYGISKDLVRDAIENFGITLYNNNEALENLFSAFVGETYDSGSEVISTLITAVEGSGSLSGSAGNEHLQPMPKTSYQKEVYKRIYHNVPLLLKSKGTERGLRALINAFGIPSDILNIKIFGGGDTGTSPFYGPSTEFTSSLDKIRITNTDSVVTGSTLSNYASVINPGKDYSSDLHTIEVGFSPVDGINNYIKTHPSMSSFNLDEYIGDPGLAYFSSYSNLDQLQETVFTSGSTYTQPYDMYDFVRLIKFFDNSIFRIIKEFTPARSNVDTGIIIKPHILDRSKIKQPKVKWSNQSSPAFFTHTNTDLDYTGSYYSTNFSIDGEIDTAFISGSTGLNSSYTSSYTETYANPSGGYQTLTRNNHDEPSYTGEFSGSTVKVSNGDLTTDNTFRKLEPVEFSFKYIPRNDFVSNATIFAESKTIFTTAETSSSLESPSQAGEGSTPLELDLDNQDISLYEVDFKLTGGPIDGTPAADSGSAQWQLDRNLANNETILLNISVDFKDIIGVVDSTGADTAILIELVSGSTVADSTTFSRTSLTAHTKVGSISFENTSGTTLTGGVGGDWLYRAKYSSKYDTDFELNGTVDAVVNIQPKVQFFDADAITVWLSEETTSNYTASFIQAMTVPLNSTTNGSMIEYMREAQEVVFEYPTYVPTDNYSSTEVTSSVQGGSYKASTSVVDNDIFLTHITSAPYSASFTQALPDLNPGQNLQFNFTVDFDSYWSTYLNTYNVANTPFVTASIRNRSTGVVTGSLTFDIQQGQYPNEYRRSLAYENTTGTALSDLEFYYQVNVPKADKGAGNPKINLKDISINYRTPVTVFNTTKVLSSQKLENTFYLDIDPNLEVYSGSLTYFEPSTDYYKVGFVTGESELFRFNDYASISNNIDSLRRSNLRLKIDEKTYTPTQGSYRGFFLPANYAILSSSIANGVEGLDERFFAEVQDSNYYATGWRNGRYDGTETNNITKGSTVIGQEPSLNFSSFNGSLFDATSPAAEIRSIFSGSTQLDGENLQVYFNTYELNKKSDLVIYTGTDASVETNATLITRSETLYKININGAVAAAGGTYSGSIGPVGEDNLIKIQYTVLFENLNQTEISSATSQFTVKLLDGITQVANEAIDITGITQGTVQSYTTYLSPSSNVTSADLQFTFTDFEGDGVGTPDITLNLIKIERFTNSTLIPSAINSKNILSTGTYQRSILRRQVVPTPTNSTGYERLVDAKIYRLDTGEVYTTNRKGVVTNIE